MLYFILGFLTGSLITLIHHRIQIYQINKRLEILIKKPQAQANTRGL